MQIAPIFNVFEIKKKTNAPMPIIYHPQNKEIPNDKIEKSTIPNKGIKEEPYTSKEIRKILCKVYRNPLFIFDKDKREIYLLTNDNIVIYNRTRTNDTVLIKADGSADSIGSHHYREIAPKGKLLKLYEETKKRLTE